MGGAMQYQIRPNILGNQGFIAVSPERAQQIERALKQIRAAIDIEELYSLILDDYVDLEAATHAATINYLVRPTKEIDAFQNTRRLFARRLMHLLTTCRAYLDATPRLLRSIPERDAKTDDLFKKFASEQYDKQFEYRFGEALRNSAQHWGLPIHGLTIGGSWIEAPPKPRARLKYSAIPTTSISELERDGKFKRKILNETRERYKEKIDMRPIVKGYVGGLSHVHLGVRNYLSSHIEHAEAVICETIASIRDFDSHEFGCALVRMKTEDTWDTVAQIHNAGIRAYRDLVALNFIHKNLALTFTSTEIDE
jgi:hypothetical protein